jgi:hypothetical protein
LRCSGDAIAKAAVGEAAVGKTASSTATELVIVLSEDGSQQYGIASQRVAGS